MPYKKDKHRKKRPHSHATREESSAYVKVRKRKHKEILVEYKGGNCHICKYDKNVGSLDFHHLGTKTFGIGENLAISMKRLKKEVDTTILVCKNCHYEIHAGMHEKIVNEYAQTLSANVRFRIGALDK